MENKYRWLVLISVSLGLFMALLDATIVTISVPAMIADFNVSVERVSWVISGYNLTFAVLLLTMGRLADQYGQKRVFLIGLFSFTLFSLLCGLASNVEWLIGARVGQAFGAAAMVPISFSILIGVFPKEKHGMVTGLLSAVGAVAASLGPTLGGLLIEYKSWHWIFLINIPIGLIAFFASWRLVQEQKVANSSKIDFGGIVLSGIGLFLLTFSMIKSNEWGWDSVKFNSTLIASVFFLILFVIWEIRSKNPMINMKLFTIRSFVASNLATFLIGIATMGVMFLLVIFMVEVMGYTELEAAIAITPMPITTLLVSPIVGKLVDRLGPRLFIVTGSIIFALGLLSLSYLSKDIVLMDIVWRTMVVGIGMGFTLPPLMSAGMESLPKEVRGVGSGALNMFRQLGFVIGVALLVALFTQSANDNFSAAKEEARELVMSQSMLPDPIKNKMLEEILKATFDENTGTTISEHLKLPENLPKPIVNVVNDLKKDLKNIFLTKLVESFTLPFWIAALAALLSVIPAMLIKKEKKTWKDSQKMRHEVDQHLL